MLQPCGSKVGIQSCSRGVPGRSCQEPPKIAASRTGQAEGDFRVVSHRAPTRACAKPAKPRQRINLPSCASLYNTSRKAREARSAKRAAQARSASPLQSPAGTRFTTRAHTHTPTFSLLQPCAGKALRAGQAVHAPARLAPAIICGEGLRVRVRLCLRRCGAHMCQPFHGADL